MSSNTKVVVPSGNIYEGLVNNETHQGTLHCLSNEAVYIGTVNNYQFDGFGIITYNNGEKYEGNWLLSAYNGTGVFTFKDGSMYEVIRSIFIIYITCLTKCFSLSVSLSLSLSPGRVPALYELWSRQNDLARRVCVRGSVSARHARGGGRVLSGGGVCVQRHVEGGCEAR